MNRTIKILHIDDNLHDRQLVKDAFNQAAGEFEIVSADNREALERHLAVSEYDLVLSDFNILGFNGFQVLQLAKEKRPDVPVIIITGTGSEEIAVQAMKLGADDYVIKTVSHIRNLVPTVRNILDKQRIRLEHASATEALRESEEKFRLLFEYSMDGVLITIQNGKILRVNPAACRIFDRTEEEIIELGREVIFNYTDPMMETALKVRDESGVFFGDLTGLRKDGTSFPIEISCALFNDKIGNRISSMIIRDITERKAAEQALQKKLDQMEHFHHLTIDRELAMMELKKEVNLLLKNSGNEEKYKLH
jgi:PAS domain S-box-containing protein